MNMPIFQLSNLSQKVLLHVRNPLTGSETVFNLLRSRRPLPTLERDPREFVSDFLRSTAGEQCNFCN